MKIEVINDKVKIDSKDFAVEDLKPELLEKIVDESLLGKVEYHFEGETPLKIFFEKIQIETSENGEFAKHVRTLEEEIKSSEEVLLGSNDSCEEMEMLQVVENEVEEIDDDLPF